MGNLPVRENRFDCASLIMSEYYGPRSRRRRATQCSHCTPDRQKYRHSEQEPLPFSPPVRERSTGREPLPCQTCSGARQQSRGPRRFEASMGLDVVAAEQVRTDAGSESYHCTCAILVARLPGRSHPGTADAAAVRGTVSVSFRAGCLPCCASLLDLRGEHFVE